MMKNLIWQHDRDISETFPQSFDLSDLNSEEVINFREDAVGKRYKNLIIYYTGHGYNKMDSNNNI